MPENLKEEFRLTNSIVQKLVSDIKHYSQLYYEGSKDTISDEAFDSIIDQLRSLDPENPVLTQVGWGYDVSKSSLEKVPHRYIKVGSLDKVKSKNGVIKKLGNQTLVATPKLDGLTVVLYYVKGVLIRAVTRGNGKIGQDVTSKLSVLVDSHLVAAQNFTGAIRGEFILPLDNWKKYYSDSPSPRNVAAGVLNRKSVSESELELFKFVAYSVVASNLDHKSKVDSLAWMFNSCCFEVTPFKHYPIDMCTPENVKADIEEISNLTQYPLDGLVLTVDEFDDKLEDGTIPVSEIAYKVVSDTAISKIVKIEWSLTRTGLYTPVAVIEPVELSGATIKRASVYNAQFVQSQGLGVGATVEIVRSGEIIPVVSEVLESAEVSLPTETEDGTPLVLEGVHLAIDKEAGSSHMDKSRLMHWITSIASVDGLGSKLISRAVTHLGVSKISDIYTVDYDISSLSSLEGFGSSTLEKFNSMISQLKSPLTPKKFLSSLGLPSLAGSSASKIVDKYSIKDILDGALIDSTGKLVKVPGVSKTAIKSIEDNLNMITEIYNLVEIKDTPSEEVEIQMTVAITGKLENGRKRQDLANLLKSNGIKVGDVKNSSYLITNDPDPTSSKAVKARKLGVETITESEFMAKFNLEYEN
ncbi:NAD-dependent DNA ligase [Listeria phage LIS04]|nr:NAD-dependent DNA ligase [Listeria phage LIS04]